MNGRFDTGTPRDGRPERGGRLRTALSSLPTLVLGGAFVAAAGPLPIVQGLGGDPLSIGLVIVLLIVCLGTHEAAHAWVALKCGDSTARDMGRLTLNPIAHIDLFMTIILPGMLLYMGMPPFGGAKPVPVDFHRLRNPWRDMSLVAFAGPFSNFLLAILFAVLWKFLVQTGWYNDAAGTVAGRKLDRLPVIIDTTVYFNVLLAIFNMVPVPPLDGSRIMAWLLPASLRPSYLQLERFGLMIVVLLIYFVPAFHTLLGRWMMVLMGIVKSIASLGGLW